MALLDGLRAAGRSLQTSRALRQLLREQRRTADALESCVTILNEIGANLAANSHRPWLGTAPSRRGEIADDSAVAAPDDGFFAEVEELSERYHNEFGRQLSPTDLLRIHAEEATQRTGDHQE